MFQGLTAGMPLYIFYKNELRVAEGRVVSANTHPPMPNPNNPMAILNGPVTDITVTVDGKNLPPFQGLAPQAMIATFSNDGLVISEDKRLIDNEIKAIQDYRQGIVDSHDESLNIVDKCRALRLSLNSELQKEVEREQELASLRGEITEMKDMLASLLGAKPKVKKED